MVVGSPGSSAVRCLAIISSAHPFHKTKAATSSHPSPTVTGEAESGSPTDHETRSPTSSGPPTATGGHMRKAGPRSDSTAYEYHHPDWELQTNSLVVVGHVHHPEG